MVTEGGQSKTRYYLYSAGDLVYEYDLDSGEERNHIFLNGKSIATLGSPLVVSDHNGNTLWHEQSDPYGKSCDRVMPTGKEFLNDHAGSRTGYTGHLKDSGSDLVYMKARYYDPAIGRFYSNDPVGFTTSNPMMFNRYAYANNNPYRYIDPNGKNFTEAYLHPSSAYAATRLFVTLAAVDAATPDPTDAAGGLKAAGYAILTGASVAAGIGLHEFSKLFNKKGEDGLKNRDKEKKDYRKKQKEQIKGTKSYSMMCCPI